MHPDTPVCVAWATWNREPGTSIPSPEGALRELTVAFFVANYLPPDLERLAADERRRSEDAGP